MKKRALHGVNLGGWLIVERWMTPSVFADSDALDEVTLRKTSEGKKRIRQHRKMFITEEDFYWMAAHEVEVVRLPFAYWTLENAEDRALLDWAMTMAEKHGLKVLLDLHAAQGSQNGQDHGGKIGAAEWFASKKHRQKSHQTLLRVARRYQKSPALWGIELLNEPRLSLRNYWHLRRFYRQTARQLRKIVRREVWIVFSDAFAPWWCNGMLWPYRRVAMDVHWYGFMYRKLSEARLRRYFGHLQRKSWLFALLGLFQPVIVGEWCSVVPHKATSAMSPEARQKVVVEHIALQQKVFASTLATCYWNYKVEGDGGWNYRDMVERGVILPHKSGKI